MSLLLHSISQSYLLISVTKSRDGLIKTLSTKRDSWQYDFTCIHSVYSVCCVSGRIVNVSGEINIGENTCLCLTEGQQSRVSPPFCIVLSESGSDNCRCKGSWWEVESRLNGHFNSTSLVPRRCYCTWCKTAQVALIQGAHAAGPRTLSASQWPTIPWSVLRWISLPMLGPGGSPKHRTSSFLWSQSIGYCYRWRPRFMAHI